MQSARAPDGRTGIASLSRPGQLRYLMQDMWTPRAALPLALLLAACQAAERPDVALRRDFGSVEVNRIGDFHLAYADYEDIAVLNALHLALRRGVPKQALEVATVAPSGLGGHGGGVAPLPHGYPSYYELWLRIAGCDSLIYMKASFTGRLFSVRDKGGCLKSAAAPTSKVY